MQQLKLEIPNQEYAREKDSNQHYIEFLNNKYKSNNIEIASESPIKFLFHSETN